MKTLTAFHSGIVVLAILLTGSGGAEDAPLAKGLKTEDLQNTTVSSTTTTDLTRLGGRQVAGQQEQIDPAQLKQMLEELQAVKQTMEERNRLLDQMMSEK